MEALEKKFLVDRIIKGGLRRSFGKPLIVDFVVHSMYGALIRLIYNVRWLEILKYPMGQSHFFTTKRPNLL